MELTLVDVSDMQTLRIAIDVGLLILIWMVQLVVYPSLTYMTKLQLDHWHPIYTRRVTVIVMPLMLGQVAAYASILLLGASSILSYISLGLIAVAWTVTFTRAVPLHGLLTTSETPSEVAKDLVGCNWYRTAMWSGVAVLSWIEVIYVG